MKVSQKYYDPILGISSANNDIRFWDKAVDTFEKKKFTDSLKNVFNYLDPYVLKKNKNLEAIIIAHGSIVMTVTIKDDCLTIVAPFVKMGEGNSTPLLRQITEINFSVLVLSQIQLRDDELYFYYQTPLELCEPYKIYDVLYEICIQADHYDDIFVEELGAKRIREPEVKAFSGGQKKKLWKRFEEILKECDDYSTHFKTERSFGVGLDAMIMTLLKMDYVINPQGKLRSDIEKLISSGLQKSNLGYPERMDDMLKGISKLREYDEERFLASMYIPNFFISIKTPISVARVKEVLANDFNNAQKEIAQSRFISAQYFLLFGLYNLLYRFSPPRRIEEMINSALKKAGNKDWVGSTNTLLNAVQKIMEIRT